MRTLQIGNDWPLDQVGGLNRYFTDLLEHLPATGTQVRGLVVGSEAASEQTGGVVSAFAKPTDPFLARALAVRRAAAKELSCGEVDLLVSHFALYAAPLGRWLHKIPFVVHFHGPWAAESRVEGGSSSSQRLKQEIERYVYRQATRLIVLSRSFQEELVRRYGVQEQQICIVPGGVDIDRFNLSPSKAEARARLGWPSDRPILLAVRRLVRRMGLENLLDAMSAVIAQRPDALLLLGGRGPLAGELKERVEARGLGEHVRLLGRIEEADLPFAYRAADLTVVPSESLEGFGLITLESLAAGTPALVTPIGGLPEIMQPFAPECVFAGTTSMAMAQTLVEALEGSRALPSSAKCRAYAEEFSWSRIAEQVHDVYVQALT